MAVKPRVKGVPRVTAYTALDAFANAIVAALTGNANFVTPAVPLATISAQIILVETAIALWGPVGARGSHGDLMNLRAACFVLRNMLIQEGEYVQQTITNLGLDYASETAVLVTSGYSAKNAGTPQGLLGQPENFHQVFKNGISIFHAGLRWAKSIGLTSPGNIKNFQVYKNIVNNNFNDPNTVLIATSTRTSYIDTNPGNAGSPVWYFITGSNAAGIGAPTAGLQVIPIV